MAAHVAPAVDGGARESTADTVTRPAGSDEVVPASAAEQSARDALRDGEYYAVAGDSILIPASAAARVGEVSGVSTPTTMAPDEEAVSPDLAFPEEVDVNAPVPDEANQETTDESPAAPIVVSAPWAACGIRDSKHKLVKNFGRAMISGVSGRTAHLRCGTAQNWSYRHIKARHMNDWQNKANYIGDNWRSFADWAWTQTLSRPCSKYRQLSNDTLQYVAPIQIRDRNGRVVHQFGTRVSIARRSQNIITAYPQRATC